MSDTRARRARTARQRPLRSGFGRFVSGAAFVMWLLVIPAVIAAIVFMYMALNEYSAVKTNLKQIVNIDLPQGAQATRVYARDYDPLTGRGTLLASLSVENRQEVTYPDIPPLLLACVLSTEDADFYYHKGVDMRGTARALKNIALRRGEVRGGGSTITQQLARNVFLPFIKSQKTLQRKVQEVIISGELERQFTKAQLVEAYLNHIYLGGGAYGVRTAAQTFFGKDLEELNLQECALIAGLPQSPSNYDPFQHPEAAESRRDEVLRLLDKRLDGDFISKLVAKDPDKFGDLNISHADVAAALKAPIKLKGSRSGSMFYKAPYFCDYLLDRVLLPTYGRDAVYGEGMTVVTTINQQYQAWAEEIAQSTVDKYRRSKHISQIQILLVEAKSGDVLANVGGYGWDKPNAKGQKDRFNRSFLASRQVGSSFKPFTYATAYEQGFPSGQVVFDAPMKDLTQQMGKQYPVNSDGHYRGRMTMASALIGSRNAAAVDILRNLAGIDAVINTCRKMGITSNLPKVPALTLGVADIYPIEMAEAYTTFPNMGVHVRRNVVKGIYGEDGNLLENNDGKSAIQRRSNRALTEQSAYMMVRNMQAAVNSGTGRAARVNGVEIAGKTGTCDDFSDAWFCGYSPELVCVVWVGNDDFRQKLNHVFGGDVPAEVFHNLMSKIYTTETKKTGSGDAVISEVSYKPAYKQTKFVKPEGVDFSGLTLNSGSGLETGDEAGESPTDGATKAPADKGKTPGNDGDGDFYKPWTPPPSPPSWEGAALPRRHGVG